MKITEIRTYVTWISPERSWLFVEIATDDGRVGLGEASQSRNDAGVIEEIRRIAPQYVGHNPLDLIGRRKALLEWPYVGRTLHAAVSGLEHALWDLCGKALQVPVYQLLAGRTRDRVRAYANIGYAATGREPEALAAAARAAVAEGYDAVKLYPFGMRESAAMSAGDEARWIAHGIACVDAVRGAVGGEVDILADLMHQFREFKQVRDVLRRLERCNLHWVEDPFVHDDPEALAQLRQAIAPRLAGGAPLLSRHAWRPLLEAHAFDVIMPDIKWLGGIHEAQALAATADVFGVQVSPHNASGPVATAACVHLALTLPNFAILEYAWGTPPWRGALCRETEQIDHGYFAPPAGHGLGVELDTGMATSHARQPHAAAPRSGVQLPRH
jgi:galactonate dehydratase